MAKNPFNKPIVKEKRKTNPDGSLIGFQYPSNFINGKKVTPQEMENEKAAIRRDNLRQEQGRLTVADEQKKQQILADAQTQVAPEAENSQIINPNIEQTLTTTQKTMGLNQEMGTAELIGKGIENTFGATVGLPIEAAKSIATGEATAPVKILLSTAASFVDVIRTAVTGKNPMAVQKAEKTFADATGIISNNIDAVKQNPSLYYEALRDFERAQAATDLIERTTKERGMINLGYWIDDGAEVEAIIANEKSRLAQLRLELDAARIAGLTAGLGL